MSKQVGRFELVEQIDPGGFTTVYRAVEDMGQGITRPAAVKVLHAWKLDDEEQLARLRHEVEVLIELGNAPNIVSILAMGIDEELGAWIAMELAGKSLAHRIEDGPAEPDEVRLLLRDVLRALVDVHGGASQILHRDLKPQNILRSSGSWKVADFGLAKRRGADETMSLATVKYAAPELLDATLGEESPRLDLYSLGMVAYEYALGRELFRAQFPSIYDPAGGSKEPEGDDRPKWMYWHTSQQMTLPTLAELIEDYPQDLSDLIAALTAKAPEKRIASAEEALRRLGDVEVLGTLRESEHEEEERGSRGVSPAIAAAAAVAVVAAMVAALLWYLLEGRPNIELDSGGRFSAPSEAIRVSGTVENYPAAGRAEIQLRRGTVRTFPVTLQNGGRFTCDVRVRAVGSFPAQMVVKDRSGAQVARASLELERVEPASVRVELATSPVVPGATVVVRPAGGDPESLTTDADGKASAEVPFGEFGLEVFHPRYLPLPLTTTQTGIDATWTRTVRLVRARLRGAARGDAARGGPARTADGAQDDLPAGAVDGCGGAGGRRVGGAAAGARGRRRGHRALPRLDRAGEGLRPEHDGHGAGAPAAAARTRSPAARGPTRRSRSTASSRASSVWWTARSTARRARCRRSRSRRSRAPSTSSRR